MEVFHVVLHEKYVFILPEIYGTNTIHPKLFLQLSLAVLLSKNLRYMPFTFKIISTVKKLQNKISTPL